jgi:hypothetical protein
MPAAPISPPPRPAASPMLPSTKSPASPLPRPLGVLVGNRWHPRHAASETRLLTGCSTRSRKYAEPKDAMGRAARLPTRESRGKSGRTVTRRRTRPCPLRRERWIRELMVHLLKECHGARSGQGTRASARRKRFHPLTAPARHDRGMLVGTKGHASGGGSDD